MVFVDPDGEDSWEINRKGVITYKNDKDDSNEYRLYSLDFDNNRTQQYVSVKDYETYSDRSRLNYIYFPKSKRLYYLGRTGYSIIRTIDNDYKRFYFGTLNHR